MALTFDEQRSRFAAFIGETFDRSLPEARALADALIGYLASRRVTEWQVTIAGTPVRLLDIPLGVLDAIARDSGRRWREILAEPLDDLGTATAIVTRLAEHRGVPAPEIASLRALVELFEEVDAQLPDEPDDEPASRVDPTGTETSTSG